MIFPNRRHAALERAIERRATTHPLYGRLVQIALALRNLAPIERTPSQAQAQAKERMLAEFRRAGQAPPRAPIYVSAMQGDSGMVYLADIEPISLERATTAVAAATAAAGS